MRRGRPFQFTEQGVLSAETRGGIRGRGVVGVKNQVKIEVSMTPLVQRSQGTDDPVSEVLQGWREPSVDC